MAVSTIDVLIALKSALLDWAIRANPSSEEEIQKVRQVLELRDELAQQLNGLVGDDLDAALAGLPSEAARLEVAANTMKSVQKNIESVQTVLDAAGTVVSVVAKLLGVVAAA